MNDFVAQRFWNRKHATIDHCSYGSRGDGFLMADVTTKLPEQSLACQGCGGRSQRRVAGRNHRSPHKLGKVVYVSHAEFIRLIVNTRRGVKNLGHLIRPQPAGDPHFIEIGIGYKREQAAVLVLPAEASDSCLSRSLKNRSHHHFAMNSAPTQLLLFRGDSDERVVIDGFHKSIPQGVEGSPQCADVFRRRYALLGLRADSAIIHDGPPGNRVLSVVDKDGRVYEIAICIVVANAE